MAQERFISQEEPISDKSIESDVVDKNKSQAVFPSIGGRPLGSPPPPSLKIILAVDQHLS